MKLHPVKTERGWELADEAGVLEAVESGPAFKTKGEAQQAALQANHDGRPFDELRAMESRFDN